MTKVYEQVDNSGLYRLAGECHQGRFVKATGHMPIRTMAEWQAMAHSGQPDESSLRWRCPVCLSYLATKLDAHGQRLPCPNCGYRDVEPQADATSYGLMSYAPPDTMTRVVALQREPHAVAETSRHPVRAVPLARPPARETYAPRSTLDGVLRVQAAWGWREPEATLKTMAAQPCERCGRDACGCPPAPPKVLEAAVARHKEHVAQREKAFERAGYPSLHAPGRA